ncbi:MAG: glycosyltransferase family 4 protein [Phycisphaerales bacterium]
MTSPTPDATTESAQPVIGLILLGGPLSGALIRDVRLANELACRGYSVHAWWAMDRQTSSPLDPKVHERWLFHGLRYVGRRRSDLADAMGRLLTRAVHDKNRLRGLQKRPKILRRVMDGLIHRVCDGVEGDRRLLRRFGRELSAAGVTHLLPMLAVLCPWAAAALPFADHPFRFLVTFQGYELYGNYARANGCESQLYARFREVVRQSDWPAIAVSEDYARRVAEDIGIPGEHLRAIPPGVPTQIPFARTAAAELVAKKFPQFRSNVPLVTYLGRRDTEKGIDLLLYAASILRRRGLEFQVAVCGPTLFGSHYAGVCVQLAEDLRCPVLWSNQVSDELRSALFFASRCVIYPSIHREPFGMVAVEAMAHGTPAIVADYGGIAGAIQAGGEIGGLHFRAWDSAHLAEQIARVLQDDDLHRHLREAGPRIAAYYSVQKLADRVLTHIGLPMMPSATDNGARS